MRPVWTGGGTDASARILPGRDATSPSCPSPAPRSSSAAVWPGSGIDGHWTTAAGFGDFVGTMPVLHPQGCPWDTAAAISDAPTWSPPVWDSTPDDALQS